MGDGGEDSEAMGEEDTRAGEEVRGIAVKRTGAVEEGCREEKSDKERDDDRNGKIDRRKRRRENGG